MKKFLVNRTREDGFTLIELLVVVIIIAILAAIAVPVYIGIQNNAKKSSIQSDVATTKLNIGAALTEDGTVNSGTFTSAAKDGDAQIQNSGVNGDETIKVTVNQDNSYSVTGYSSAINYANTYDSASAQTTNDTAASVAAQKQGFEGSGADTLAINTGASNYSTGADAAHSGAKGVDLYGGTQVAFTVTGGKSYTVSYWAKSDPTFSGAFTVQVNNAGYTPPVSVTPTTSWVQYSYTWVAPAGSNTLIFRGNANTTFLDDITVG